MKRILGKAAIVAVTLPLVTLAAHTALYEAHNWSRTKRDRQAIYAIGDSRFVHGVDIDALRELTGRPVHSYATQGASAYTFYAMAASVPVGATVIVAPSFGMFVRRRELLSYGSGLSLRGLGEMVRLGYPWWYFQRILSHNRFPLEAPHMATSRFFYENREKPFLAEERFREIYDEPERPEDADRNMALFYAAMERLYYRRCTVHVVELPVMPSLEEMHTQSIYKSLGEELPWLRADRRFQFFTGARLEHPEGLNIWHDLDHLNVRGRQLMTRWIAQEVLQIPLDRVDEVLPIL